ncbi:LOW QUALITY PROTEIN: interferon-induced protein with tetratricopeptide repeats 3-like [Acanthopagrus schlegelii]
MGGEEHQAAMLLNRHWSQNFTWDLGEPSRSKLFRLRHKLEHIGTKEGYSWLGHIYNLQCYIHYQLGFSKEALRFFSRSAEAFRQMRNIVSEEVVVNYGNQAWLHHHLGEAESQAYLSKVDTLMNKHPSPSQDKLQPEIYAEKAWTLMKFNTDKEQLAVNYSQRAIRMQPDMVEWHTSHVLALVNAFKHCNKKLEADILEKMKIIKEHDPENLYLAALYLKACPKKGKKIQDEVCELARKVLRKPVRGIKPVLRLYRIEVPMDEAIDLAEEILERGGL